MALYVYIKVIDDHIKLNIMIKLNYNYHTFNVPITKNNDIINSINNNLCNVCNKSMYAFDMDKCTLMSCHDDKCNGLGGFSERIWYDSDFGL